MRGEHLIGGLLIAACVSAFASIPVSAMDPLPEVLATVTFPDIDPNPGVSYTLRGEIELVGTDKKFKVNCSVGAGSTGKALCATIDFHLKKNQEGWTCKSEDNKLEIVGWKDPKTGTFHKVKKVTFTSPDLPKNQMPKVTNPKEPVI